MDENPFKILGLAPEALHGRTDPQIREIVKSFGRSLAKIDHPDKGGNVERFRQVQDALSALEDDEAFRESKKEFLTRSARSAMAKLNRVLAETEQANTNLHNQMHHYAGALYDSKRLSVFSLYGHKLRLHDTVEQEKRGGAHTIARGNLPPAFFTLTPLNVGGFLRKDRKSSQIIGRKIIGCIPFNKDPGFDVRMLLAECQHMEKPRDVHLLSGHIKFASFRTLANTVPLARATPILTRLSPYISIGGHLFSVTKMGTVLSVYCEGKVTACAKAAES